MKKDKMKRLIIVLQFPAGYASERVKLVIAPLVDE
jgi:hypothetical protein